MLYYSSNEIFRIHLHRGKHDQKTSQLLDYFDVQIA